MKQLYTQNSANYPRLKTDKFFADYGNTYHYNGFMDKAVRFIADFQLLRPELWKRFVAQFTIHSDNDGGWRGEYWGKMMRGACFVYTYTRDPQLYEILTNTVSDMIEAAETDGRISSYPWDVEFNGWDIWCRKYVLLGMQYYLEICEDASFAEKICQCMCRQADYIMSRIGKVEDGKRLITEASGCWRGLNSSSLLEPIVRLYNITGQQKYFDFAQYIIDAGGMSIANVFDLAYDDQFLPYQYPMTKAYEMTSCFEGLLEFYRITGNERYIQSVLRFADRILETDFTVIGSSGCTHELFDHSTVRQANTNNGPLAQETCVTVTLMKFFYQLHLLTGDAKYADVFEKSLYNAYLGAINTEKVIEPKIKNEHSDWHIEPLPFDSYSPLTAGTRGIGVGGLQLMPDNHYYGCCACIGSAGIGLVPKMQLVTTHDGFAYNLFIAGDITTDHNGEPVSFHTNTDYPASGTVTIEVDANDVNFDFMIRIPAWSAKTSICVNGDCLPITEGYTHIQRTWNTGDKIEIQLDMRTKAIFPIAYGKQILMTNMLWTLNYSVPTYDVEDPMAKYHIALQRGPVMLAQDNQLGYSVDAPVSIQVSKDGFVDATLAESANIPYPNMVGCYLPLSDGGSLLVTDYASAGKLWTNESKMAVWMLTKEHR